MMIDKLFCNFAAILRENSDCKHKMKRLFWAFLATMLILSACTGNRQTTEDVTADSTGVADTVVIDTLEELIAETPMPSAADELFDDFIFNFAASKTVQLQRIQFPLPVIKGETQELVQKNAWTVDHFFMQQGYYTLIFDNEKQKELCNDTSINHVVVEKIYLNKKFIRQYDFQREKGLWMLKQVRLTDIENSPNTSFLTFYHNFASDSLFQAQSLNTTVDFVGPDPDDDFAQMQGVITPETWPAFAPELPTDMIYNIIYGNERSEGNQKVFVIRGIANGFEVELTFKLSGGKWRLMKMVT